MKVLVTGASGFVGRHLVSRLSHAGLGVRAAVRQPVDLPCEVAMVGDMEKAVDWSMALRGVEVVVHLAGRAQADTSRNSPESEAAYHRVNAEATRVLAGESVRAGVRQFVLMSSVHAVAAESDEMIAADTRPCPVSAYGRSKLAAEAATRQAISGSGCASTILRPPAVYGPGNTANLGKLLKLAASGVPLPLASVRNRRSFVFVENLTGMILSCLGNPAAFGKIFLPSDAQDVSTPELINAIARANAAVGKDKRNKIGPPGKTSRSPLLFSFPESVLKAMGRMPGLGALRKLTSSLFVDSEPVRRELGYKPCFTMHEGLMKTLAGG